MNKTIKGQAWISGDSLLQDQTIISTDGTAGNKVEVLIKDIWKDLVSESTTAKHNKKKTYFYWEYKQTSTEDDSVEVTVMIECPRPKDGMFKAPFEPEKAKTEWGKYWLSKFKTAYDNATKSNTIQPREIVFPGTEYVNPQGDIVKVPASSTPRNDLGDITNLLMAF